MPCHTAPACHGGCCAVLCLSVDHATLLADPERFTDGPFLAEMLILLEAEEVAERRERFGIPAGDEAREWFTCKHFDEIARRCTAYEDRPGMCRIYPNGTACEHGCGQAALESA